MGKLHEVYMIRSCNFPKLHEVYMIRSCNFPKLHIHEVYIILIYYSTFIRTKVKHNNEKKTLHANVNCLYGSVRY